MDSGWKSNGNDEEPTATPTKGIEGIRSTINPGNLPCPVVCATGEQVGVSGSKRKRRKHYVYLVFDDWSYGYSIHKVNLFPCSRRRKQTAFSAPADVPCLPPALFRLEAAHGSPEYIASAFGTRILAMHTRDPGGKRLLSGTFVPMLDVSSLSMTFCPGQEYPINPIYLSVGNTRLFCLSEASFEMLHWEPLCPPPLGRRRSKEWSWQRLEKPPFKSYNVTSYAVHPQRCTIFVSTKMNDIEATFSFDMEKQKWEQLGSWALPFAGRGHFDPYLNAFVGLSKDSDTLGQVYSCCLSSSSTGHGLEWKLGKERLFSQDPAERHVGATLVYVGQSKFCLVQCVSIEDESDGPKLKEEGNVGGPVYRTEDRGADLKLNEGDVQELKEEGDVQELKEEGDVDGPGYSIEDEGYDQELMDEGYDQELMEERYVPCCCLYRLTTFSLSYDIKGDLTTGNSCRVLYYKVPEAITSSFLVEDPVAFCM
ncbi:hypothetical protein CFC21_061915 [Triticum aestivum]|uniref:Uncharacterized protein n=2 Tax=Triticum aestivum TaxID=4565 RepID=A0A9R1GW10_WHEAT|nr:hypothetical protein CFC21_061915 [Triticum aestivum]